MRVSPRPIFRVCLGLGLRTDVVSHTDGAAVGTVEKVGLTAGMWSAADPFVRALDRA
ncbi:hypothetical protein GFS60_03404 [Rhodococcus sp. WAY2]|nr:hypothetical protein GFS60_03404 [Rhodococcus sp. WAY2]